MPDAAFDTLGRRRSSADSDGRPIDDDGQHRPQDRPAPQQFRLPAHEAAAARNRRGRTRYAKMKEILMDTHGITVPEAAAMVGKSPYTVMAWRKGMAPPRPGKTEKSRSAYRCPPEAVDMLREAVAKRGTGHHE